MDLNALMQAAAQDPKAAAFLQQMLAGGTPMDQRLPKIAPQELRVPKISDMGGGSPLPVFKQAQSTMDELLKRWGPGAAGEQQPGGFQPQPVDTSGMPPPTSLGGSAIPRKTPA